MCATPPPSQRYSLPVMDFIRGKGFEKRVIPMFAPETSSDKPSEKAASEVKLITPYPNGMYMFNLRGLTSLFLFCTSPYQDHIRRKNTGGRGARWLVPPTIVSLWNGGGQAGVNTSEETGGKPDERYMAPRLLWENSGNDGGLGFQRPIPNP
ncbi:predicted protein [Coccidioides posadasii str. Silveira]|uniref:Predicted protein n=1 Tax=Coccidioides posadasii (strain RMSCC 757 / Silveira) TaxID=443226 RepID=E9DDT4_COCPS|nr:predicted protein [Coccidioides posadasii str. Silveira]